VDVYAAPDISFAISNNTIQTNQAFTIDVLASSVDSLDELIAFGFNTVHDATWTLDSVTIGSGFDDNSGLFANTAVAGSAFPSGPSGNNILLATLQFTASTAGHFNFGIASNLTNPNEGLFLLNETDAFDLTHSQSVTVNAVPVPAAVWLFGSALAGFMGMKRRKNGLAV